MELLELYVRVKDNDSLVKVELAAEIIPEKNNDILWESKGEYQLEAYLCGNFPSACSIEKDPRILNPKYELSLMILDSMKNNRLLVDLF